LCPRKHNDWIGQVVSPIIKTWHQHEDSFVQKIADETYIRKLEELDRLLNHWEVPMQPELVWRLLDEVSEQSRAISKPPQSAHSSPDTAASMGPGARDDPVGQVGNPLPATGSGG
jgi:hypothetical protein